MIQDILREVVVITVGKQAEPLINLLYGKKHINEFIIAKNLEVTINQARNMLYKLADFGLVSSIRKKDKRKGWYTYFWMIEVFKSLEFLRDYLKKKIDQFENQADSRETKQFYICERCNVEFTEENALLNDFTCNECGDLFTTKDNTKLVRELKRRSKKLSTELEVVEEEIKKELIKIGKKREKEFAKEKKEKAEKRAANRQAKKKLTEESVIKESKEKKSISPKKLVKKKNSK